MDRDTGIEILKQVLEGMAALHIKGFIHRDLKPDNIGLKTRDPPHALIFDFGQAIQTDALVDPQPGQIGTVSYLAPEMESRRYDNKVDIWAFAVVALQVLLRQPSLASAKAKGGYLSYQIVRYLMDALADSDAGDADMDLIEQLVEKNPVRRFSAAQALQHRLFGDISNIEETTAGETICKRYREQLEDLDPQKRTTTEATQPTCITELASTQSTVYDGPGRIWGHFPSHYQHGGMRQTNVLIEARNSSCRTLLH